MQANNAQPQLRDIHLPDSVSWWPPADGYWLGLAAFILLFIFYLMYRRWKKNQQIKKTITHELMAIERIYRHSDNKQVLISNLSTLMRRIAVSHFPNFHVESLTGKRWLQFLDETMKDKSDAFLNGPGQILATAPYTENPEYDADALLSLCKQWILNVIRNKARHPHKATALQATPKGSVK